MEVAAKRQRVLPLATSGAADDFAQNSSAINSSYNGSCCGGPKLAGTAPGYKLVDNIQIQLAKRTKASWIRKDDKVLVAAKCGKCKKIIVPNSEQLARMERFKLKSVLEEVELRDFEVKTGISGEEAIALLKDSA